MISVMDYQAQAIFRSVEVVFLLCKEKQMASRGKKMSPEISVTLGISKVDN